MKTKLIIIGWLALCCFSCRKYLDEKPNGKLAIPVSLQDAQSLLDSYSLMNSFYPSIGLQSDDDFYLDDSYVNTLTTVNLGNYTWRKDVVNDLDWGYMYQMVLYANTALETVQNIPVTTANTSDWKSIKGSALFFRSMAFFQLAEYYAMPYDQASAPATPGIPLRLNSDIGVKSVRSSLRDTYQRIIDDLMEAAALLPVTNPPLSRPAKPAAFAALARTFLAMEDYSHAALYADSSLQLNSTLMDYNTLNPSASQPFSRFNSEVLFAGTMFTYSMFGVNNLKVDSLLYQSYASNDLRKTLFFQSNGVGTFGFKGSYDGSTNFFNGLATDEVKLLRAEGRARTGDLTGAMADLNTLLMKRYKSGTFVPVTALSQGDAVRIILTERRKELVFRGLRWFDLRRLNRDSRFAKTLTRKVNGQVYSLPPGDPKYTEYIPFDVIGISGMEQNNR